MVDPSLIIYHPVRLYNGTLVVTNGDQTDTIVDYLKQDVYKRQVSVHRASGRR